MRTPRPQKSWRGINCYTCMTESICQPAAISKPFGCASWVSMDGSRCAPPIPRIGDEPQTGDDPDSPAVVSESYGLIEDLGALEMEDS